MARVLVLCADLMFGSRIAAQLQGAAEQFELVSDAESVTARLKGPADLRPEVLVVDLTGDPEEGIGLVERLAGEGDGSSGPAGNAPGPAVSEPGSAVSEPGPGSPRTLGFYSHVEADVRERAERAGFDLVVPRSRMAREGAALVGRLLEGAPRRTSG